jgi:hypothetical protein
MTYTLFSFYFQHMSRENFICAPKVLQFIEKSPDGEGLDAHNRYFTGRMPCSKVQGTVNSNPKVSGYSSLPVRA